MSLSQFFDSPERKEIPSFNPVTAQSAEEARLMQDTLPEGVPVKITPQRIPNRNPGLLDMAFRDAGVGKVKIEFPVPDRVPATTEFIDVKTEGGTVSIPVIPADPADPGLIIDINRNPESIELEERARRMRDAGPNPHLSI